jgi:hypothetical protein
MKTGNIRVSQIIGEITVFYELKSFGGLKPFNCAPKGDLKEKVFYL